MEIKFYEDILMKQDITSFTFISLTKRTKITSDFTFRVYALKGINTKNKMNGLN